MESLYMRKSRCFIADRDQETPHICWSIGGNKIVVEERTGKAA